MKERLQGYIDEEPIPIWFPENKITNNWKMWMEEADSIVGVKTFNAATN